MITLLEIVVAAFVAVAFFAIALRFAAPRARINGALREPAGSQAASRLPRVIDESVGMF